jgi:hypothetical protein
VSVRSRRAYQAAFALLLLILAVLAGLVLRAGTMVQTNSLHDVLIFLDGAWKVLHGVRPHADFYTPLGPLNYVLPALAMTVYGPDAFAISLANLALCAACVLGAWFVLKSRLTPLHCLVLLSFAALEMLRCRQLFRNYDSIGYAMLYNRQCYAILILAMTILLLPRYAPTRRGQWQDAVAVGVLLGLAAFIKISYVVAAMPLLAVGCMSLDWRWTLRRLAGVAVGGLAVALPILIYLRFDLLSIYRDLAMGYRARLGGMSVLGAIGEHTGMPEMLLVYCLAMWAATQMPSARLLKILCTVGAIWLAQELIIATNAEEFVFGVRTDVPLLLAAIVIPLELLHRRWAAQAAGPRPSGRRRLAAYCLAGLLGATLLGYTMVLEVRSLCFACTLHNEAVTRSGRFRSPSLGSLVGAEVGRASPILLKWDRSGAAAIGPGTFGTFADKVNDGLDLLESLGDPSARVQALGFTDPFPFAARRPPTASPSYWRAGVNVSEDARPAAERVFAGTDAVLLPKYVEYDLLGTQTLLLKMYGPYLREHFTKKAESLYWTLYVRKDYSRRARGPLK